MKRFRAGAMLLALLASPGESQATPGPDFTIVSESVTFDPATRTLQFTIEFSRAADFVTLAYGRQAYAFQYFFVGDPDLPYPQNYDSIIRGGEIYLTTDSLRIRNAYPSDPDLASGGWGSIRGSVPFVVRDNTVTFSVPLELVSDHNGSCTYWLMSTQFSRATSYTQHRFCDP